MRRSIILVGFSRSTNPWFRGIKPKRFLESRVELMKENIIMNDKRKFNPDWAKEAA